MNLKESDLFLHSDSPSLPYIENLKCPSLLHFGQLKLFTTTLYFILRFVKGKNPKIVIPGGGSYSVNNGLISDLFPSYQFYIIDPIPPSFGEKPNVTYTQSLFTDEMVEYWSNQKNVYLISDIRSSSEDGKERDVEFDNSLQKSWVEKIKPEFSFLKFRIPFDYCEEEREYDYLDGKILFQCFQKPDSNETRLIVPKKFKLKSYDSQKYEEQLSYHNLVTRRRRDKKTMLYPELVGDFDSNYFILVCKLYLKETGNDKINIKDFIINILKILSPNKKLSTRRKEYEKKIKESSRYINEYGELKKHVPSS
jgi:hypothetical protein